MRWGISYSGVVLLAVVAIALLGLIGYKTLYSEAAPPSATAGVSTELVVADKAAPPGKAPSTAETSEAPIPAATVGDDRQGNQTSRSWLFVALVVMGIATVLSVAVSFYLYRWRRILLSNPNMIVPEEWAKHLVGLGKHIENLTKSFTLGVGALNQQTAGNSDRVTNMVETFMTLQKALDERDAEIRRLKKGYDAEVFRKFLYRFIRIDQSIDDFLRSGLSSPENLGQIKRLLEDAFDECGVEAFEPELGSDYRTADGVADNPKTTLSDNPEDAFKIAELLEAGYRLRGGEGYEIIVPAKVCIYTE